LLAVIYEKYALRNFGGHFIISLRTTIFFFFLRADYTIKTIPDGKPYIPGGKQLPGSQTFGLFPSPKKNSPVPATGIP
jgi:hypothetical protein